MNRFFALILAFVLLPAIAFSQQPVFDEFAVDSTAQPRGGMDKLTLFLKVNQRLTLPMQVRGANGRVFVQGIVEPDGSLSEPTVLRGIQPDFDREALRLMGLFRAWQPARKGGQAVRQKTTVPVEFRVPPAPWTYENGVKTQWFNAEAQPIADPALASFRIETRMDSLGNYTGDGGVFQSKKPMKVYLRSRFERTPVQSVRSVKAVPEDSANYFRLALLIPAQSPDGEVRYLDKAGNLSASEMYEEGKSVPPYRFYHPNGVLSSLITKLNEQETQEIAWYPNGQMRKIEISFVRPGKTEGRTVAWFWLASGEALVAEGNGAFRDTITFGDQKLIETGIYRNGRKDGSWRGVFTDERPYYDEEYLAGELLKGVSYLTDGSRVEYTLEEQQAEFKGGQAALGNFLMQTLSYPINAQRSRVQGKVFVSFVVETDGTLSEIVSINHPNEELKWEALRVVRKMSGFWTPGIQRGRKVKTRFTLPITFQLE